MLRLALALGKSIREVEALDARELAEWVAYDRIEGIPQPWRQAGTIAAAAANPYRGKGRRAFGPEDFMPIIRPKRVQSDEQIWRLLQVALGGRKRRGEGAP
jgi:hypothetical protein